MAALGNKPRPEAVGSAPRAQPQAAAVARGGRRRRPAGEEAGRFGGQVVWGLAGHRVQAGSDRRAWGSVI